MQSLCFPSFFFLFFFFFLLFENCYIMNAVRLNIGYTHSLNENARIKCEDNTAVRKGRIPGTDPKSPLRHVTSGNGRDFRSEMSGLEDLHTIPPPLHFNWEG
jgi:hypothetical protein